MAARGQFSQAFTNHCQLCPPPPGGEVCERESESKRERGKRERELLAYGKWGHGVGWGGGGLKKGREVLCVRQEEN